MMTAGRTRRLVNMMAPLANMVSFAVFHQGRELMLHPDIASLNGNHISATFKTPLSYIKEDIYPC